MSDENKIDIKLDLDGKEFVDKWMDAVERVDKLIENFKNLALVAGSVAVAYAAIKTAVDMAFQAEEIAALRQQFDLLAQQAGVAGETLRQGMEKASGGLIEESEQLRIANKALVELHGNAKRLPEIMEVARKATIIFGGTFSDNLERITHAIAVGQTKTLKQFGLEIQDADSKYAAFAKSINIASNELNDAGKRQVLLEEVIKRGKENFGGIRTDIREMASNWTRFKVAMSDAWESFELFWGKLATPLIRPFVDALAAMAKLTKEAMGGLANGSESAEVKIGSLKTSITKTEGEIAKIQQTIAHTWDPRRVESLNIALMFQRNHLKDLQRELDQYQQKLGAGRKPSAEGGSKDDSQFQDQEKHKKNEAKFLGDMAALRKQYENEVRRVSSETLLTEEQLARQSERLRLDAILDSEKKIAEIRANEALTSEQKSQEILQVHRNTELQLRLISDQTLQRKLQAIRQYEQQVIKSDGTIVGNAKAAANGIEVAFKAGAAKAGVDLQNFQKTGQQVYSSFVNQSTSALQEWGAGHKTAAEAAKGFIFGMIADVCEAKGQELLLTSIYPPNPLGLAAGAGLIALSGFLRSQAQGASGGIGGGGGAAAAGPAYAAASDSSSSSSSNVTQGVAPKSVSIHVAGHYFDTEEGSRRMAELIRQAGDATDVRID